MDLKGHIIDKKGKKCLKTGKKWSFRTFTENHPAQKLLTERGVLPLGWSEKHKSWNNMSSTQILNHITALISEYILKS